MKTREEIRDWMLENCVDSQGNLDLKGLDFSSFDGNIDISHMKTKKSLDQSYQEVCGYLHQEYQKVGRTLYQDCQKVRGNLWQSCQVVEQNIFQDRHMVKENLFQEGQRVGGDMSIGYIHVGGKILTMKGGFITKTEEAKNEE